MKMTRLRRVTYWFVLGLLALLLAADIAIVAQWVRTSSLGDIRTRNSSRVTVNGWRDVRVVSVACIKDRVFVLWTRGRDEHGNEPGSVSSDQTVWKHERAQQPGPRPGSGQEPGWVRRLGLGWHYLSYGKRDRDGWSSRTTQAWVVISYLDLLLLSLLAKASLIFSLWRITLPLRRTRKGLCGQCGYDIHATPERCPECGTECGAAASVE